MRLLEFQRVIVIAGPIRRAEFNHVPLFSRSLVVWNEPWQYGRERARKIRQEWKWSAPVSAAIAASFIALSISYRTVVEPPVIVWNRGQWVLVWLGVFVTMCGLIWAASCIPLSRRVAVYPRHFWTGRMRIPFERIKRAQLRTQDDYSVLALTLISGVAKEFGVPRGRVEEVVRVLEGLHVRR